MAAVVARGEALRYVAPSLLSDAALVLAAARMFLNGFAGGWGKIQVLQTKKQGKHTPWKMNGWNLQPSPMKRKENDLNQTSIIVFHPLIFRGVICTKKGSPKTGETQKFDESTPL